MAELRDYPYFSVIANSLDGLQRKNAVAFFSEQNEDYFEFAEKLSFVINKMLLNAGQNIIIATDAYKQMCKEMLKEQIRFKKTGKYLHNDANLVFDAVYNDPTVMRDYMLGLLMTYLFWPNHYKMFQFFKEVLQNREIHDYLEVGAGHGLFVSEIIMRSTKTNIMVVDISEESVHMCKQIIEAAINGICRERRATSCLRPRFINKDFLLIENHNMNYDFITMGEVLEHVNNPKDFLNKARSLLKEKGSLFLSTCANCPAADHIYHFRSVEEIREIIQDSGFDIASELVLPIENVPEQMWESEMTGINYAALLEV